MKNSDIFDSSNIGHQNTNIGGECYTSFYLSSSNDSDSDEHATNESDNNQHARISPY